jgi:predicted transposase/invertase (TIGR01784 family)
MSRFFDPCNDVAFKKVFNEHKDLTISFLNATLRLEGNRRIEAIDFLPQELLPMISESKKSILDVKCTDQAGNQYIVEVQNKYSLPYLRRIQFYASHTYVNQLKHAVSYLELKPVTMLSILNHQLLHEDVPCLSFHTLQEETTKRKYLNDMSYAFIELPKFTKKWEELKTIEEYWIYILKQATDMTSIPSEAPEEIKSALHILEEHTWSDAEQDAYVRAKLLVMDEEAEDAQWQNAVRDSKAEGIAQGKQEERLAIANAMLSKGMDLETIALVTNLTIAEIN